MDKTEPSVYAVGILRDFKEWRKGTRGKGWRGIKETWYWFRTSCTRRSYWNGYLAETENKARCGRGWTKRGAIRSWRRIPEL